MRSRPATPATPVCADPRGDTVGVGIDVVDIAELRWRIARAGSRYLTAVFTASELERSTRCAEGTSMLAATLAAKRAALKALGAQISSPDPSSLEVSGSNLGTSVVVALAGPSAELARQRGAEMVTASVSWDRRQAAAVAVATAAPRPPPPVDPGPAA